MAAAGRMNTMIWRGTRRRRGLMRSATDATDQRRARCPAAGPCHPLRAALLRGRLEPLRKSGLNLGRRLLRGELPADDTRTDSPQLVLLVGFPSAEHLVLIAVGGLAGAPSFEVCLVEL